MTNLRSQFKVKNGRIYGLDGRRWYRAPCAACGYAMMFSPNNNQILGRDFRGTSSCNGCRRFLFVWLLKNDTMQTETWTQFQNRTRKQPD